MLDVSMELEVSKVVVENSGLMKAIGPFFLHVFACFHCVLTCVQ